MKLFIFLLISTYSGYVCSFDDETTEYDQYSVFSSINEELDPIFEESFANVVALVAETGAAGYLGQLVKAGFQKALHDKKILCSGNECQVPNVRFKDTGTSSRRALHYFKRYYSQGVRTFIGLVTSDEAKAVAEYASKHATDAVLFSPTSTATELCMYKNQLLRLSMDDRGYAEVLFNLANRFNKNGDSMFIQVIYRNDIHSKGLYNDILKKFRQASNETFKLLDPISYDPEDIGLTNSNVKELTENLNKSKVAKKKNAFVVLIGLQETQLILQEAAKHSSLRGLTWILSDALTLSNLKVPENMDIFGITFMGKEDESKLLKKERYGLHRYLNEKNLPPMKQAQLAYDVIGLLEKGKTVSQYINNLKVAEGLTGPLEFSKCGERFSGSYLFAINPKSKEVNNIAKKIVMQKWMEIWSYNIQSNELHSQLVSDEYSSPETMMEVQLESTSKNGVSTIATPAVEIKKSEFLKQIVEIGDKNCEKNAQLFLRSKDELSEAPVNLTYTITQMPESIVLPAKYGFIMIATCRTKIFNIQFTRVCPPTNIGGGEVICETKITFKAIGQVPSEQMFRIGEGGNLNGCDSGKVLQATCIVGAGGCFIGAMATAGVSAPACGLLSVAGCGGVSMLKEEACEAEKKGGKYVCTELFRQGFLTPDIMLADMSFAKHYSVDFPITRKGYDILGPVVASWMSTSEWVTNAAKYIAIPWAEEMAYNEGFREVGNDFGALVMNIGSIICAFVGAVYLYFNYVIGSLVLTAFVIAIKKTHIKFYVPFAKKNN